MSLLSGIKIRKRRIRKRLTLSEVADFVGFSRRTLINWEQGKIPKKPNQQQVDRLCEKLDCSLVEIIPTELKRVLDVVLSDLDDFMHEPDYHIANEGVSLIITRILRLLIFYETRTKVGIGSFVLDDSEPTDDEVEKSDAVTSALKELLLGEEQLKELGKV